MRKIWKLGYLIFNCVFLISCDQKDITPVIQIKKLDYPSASSVEYYEGKLYVMGDDATNLLVIDTNLNILDSVPLITFSNRRIPKDVKPDLEASAIDSAGNLYLFGSGSTEHRNSAWRYNLKNKNIDSINFEPLYSKIKNAGVEQINIEGACFVAEKLILVNRGNKSYPENHLIIINENFWDDVGNIQFSVIPFSSQKDASEFRGISGLCYAKNTDKLIMTVSTEDTRSSYEDGPIGKSYLWAINNISTKLNDKTISRNRLVDLEYLDPRFKGQKIESATVINETDKLIYLVLVADNDDGSSTIFKMSIGKSNSLHGE
jgi:hypothetical protein